MKKLDFTMEKLTQKLTILPNCSFHIEPQKQEQLKFGWQCSRQPMEYYECVVLVFEF